MKTIYTLAIKRADRWIPEFSSYNKDKVYSVRSEYDGYASVILQTDDASAEIDNAITVLNLKWG